MTSLLLSPHMTSLFMTAKVTEWCACAKPFTARDYLMRLFHFRKCHYKSNNIYLVLFFSLSLSYPYRTIYRRKPAFCQQYCLFVLFVIYCIIGLSLFAKRIYMDVAHEEAPRREMIIFSPKDYADLLFSYCPLFSCENRDCFCWLAI